MASTNQPYGPMIDDALQDPKTTLETLIKLRDRAVQVLKAQGDLSSALKRLDKEISRREKKPYRPS